MNYLNFYSGESAEIPLLDVLELIGRLDGPR
jgi:hypothetical protein